MLILFFLLNSLDGKATQKWGSSGVTGGKFYGPTGVTVDDKYAYICDRANHRVQLLTKEKGAYITGWGTGNESTLKGEFSYPRSIYYEKN